MMQPALISQLIELNTAFYNTVAVAFDESRTHRWSGWHQLFSGYIPPETQSILDIGCGNGRFGALAFETFPQLNSYVGIDANQTLLSKARTTLKQYPQAKFEELNVFETIRTNSFTNHFARPFDVLALFGVLHHVPSGELRQKLFVDLRQLATNTSYIIFTTWQFMEFERFRKKIINPSIVGISPAELETGDYLLDWKRGTTAIRYCHYFQTAEVEHLLATAGLELIDSFRADGKEKTVNKYYICKIRV